jgi:hypothetical protein
MQDGATAHIANYSSNVLNEVYEDRLISCRLRPQGLQTKSLSFLSVGKPKKQSVFIYVGFEVLAAVVMKSIIFLDIMPCSPLRVN